MPVIASYTHTLTAADIGTRVKLQTSGSTPVNVEVGNTSEPWTSSCWLEVVHVGTAPVTFVPSDFSVTLNVMTTDVLRGGEYAKLVYVGSNTWDLHIHTLPTRVAKPAPLTPYVTANSAETVGHAGHHNSFFIFNGSNATVNVPSDFTWTGTDPYWANDYNPVNPGPMPTGGSMLFTTIGAGTVTFVPDLGVTIRNTDGLAINTMNGMATLIKLGTDDWIISGYLALPLA